MQGRWTSGKVRPRGSIQSSGAWFLLSLQCLPGCWLYSSTVLPLTHKVSCTVVSASSITFLGFLLFVQPLELCKSPNENKELIESDEGMLRQQSYICINARCCFKSKVQILWHGLQGHSPCGLCLTFQFHFSVLYILCLLWQWCSCNSIFVSCILMHFSFWSDLDSVWPLWSLN